MLTKNRKTSAVCLTVFVSPLNVKRLDRLRTCDEF